MPELKLHLGAFDHIVPGWINTDVTPHLRVARVPGLAWLLRRLGIMGEQRYEQHCRGVFRQMRRLDVSRRFPWPDGSVAAAYCSHLLEHLYPEEAERCVAEVARVLRPGGVFRIAVPDLDAIVRAYDAAEPERFLDAIFEGRHRHDKNRHHWHYNEALLRALLTRAGFASVRRCEYRKGSAPDVEALDTRPESLFVEGVR